VNVAPGAYSGTFEGLIDSNQPPVADHYQVTGPVTLEVAAAGVVTGSFSVHVSHTYDLSGDIPEHQISTWDMQGGTLHGSVCQLGLDRGQVGPMTCQDSKFGDCSAAAPGAFGGPDVTVPTSNLGAPTVAGNKLTWLLSYDGQVPGLIEHWSIAVLRP
jgi:hypothetical protein